MHLYHVETQFVALADPNWLPKRCLSSSKHQQGPDDRPGVFIFK